MDIADFSRVDVVTCNEKLYLGKLIERDDITVVCEGLFGQLERVKDFLDVVDYALEMNHTTSSGNLFEGRRKMICIGAVNVMDTRP